MTLPLRILLSLASKDNDYQRAQARAAEEAVKSKNATVQVCFCDGNAVEQSQQILKHVLYSSDAPSTHGIVVQPVGTGLTQVAHAATKAGIGWCVLHREVDYVSELRVKHNVPVFVLTSDHKEVGQIQAKQLAALIPKGGRVLQLVGPSTDSVAQQRSIGLSENKPENIQLSMIRGDWTTESGLRAVSAWWNLPTSRQQPIVAVVAQNDAMALGAKRALQEIPDDLLSNIPVIGCDGLPESGQAWVQKHLLKATVVLPVLAGLGVEMLAKAMMEKQNIPDHTVIAPTSYPSLRDLHGALG